MLHNSNPITMSTPIISWSKDSSHEFFVNITGNLTAAGETWAGTTTSPAKKWKVTFPQVVVAGGPNSPTPWAPNYHFSFGQITGQLLNSHVTFNSGGGYSSQSPNLPWGSGIDGGFMFTNVPTPNVSAGSFYMTFTWASTISNFSTWRYSIDIAVNGI